MYIPADANWTLTDDMEYAASSLSQIESPVPQVTASFYHESCTPTGLAVILMTNV